jgi:chromosome segregation ATPase
MQRTIAQARDALDQLNVSPGERDELERATEAVIREAVQAQEEVHLQEQEEIRSQIDSVKKALGQVSRDLSALDAESRTSEMTSAEYHSEFRTLQVQRRELLAKAERLRNQIDDFEIRDDDVEGYLDELFTKYPTLRPDFPI